MERNIGRRNGGNHAGENNEDTNRTICLYNGTVFTGITRIERCSVLIQNGRIENVLSNRRLQEDPDRDTYEVVDVNGLNIASGLIDTHIHGIHGYGTEDCSVESILGMSEYLPAYGVTSFIPTIYPMALDDMDKAIRAITESMGKEKGARILGIHMEGPFISSEKLGVQNPEFVQPVDLDLFEHLWEVSEGKIITMTVAPELKHMRELALAAVKKGITLQAGHSNATYEQMVEGIEAGILHSTHFFNAMRSLHHRDPGVVGAILIHQELSCELIADTFHLHPAIITFLIKEKGTGGIVLVTDGLKPTGLTKQPLYANNEEVVIRDGLFHRVKDDTIAGSNLTLNKGVFNITELQIPLQEALKMANLNPARILNIETRYGSLLPEREADVIVFDDEMTIMRTYVSGNPVYDILGGNT